MERDTETATGSVRIGDPRAEVRLSVVASSDPAQRGHQRILTRDLPVGRKVEPPGWVLSDRRVSSDHAAFVSSGPAMWVLEDRGSKNGTHVQGRQVRRRVLSDGDVVRIGDTVMVFESGAPAVERPDVPGYVGESQVTCAVLREAARAAATSMNVVITGETGVGKEILATGIHALSGRSGPLHAVNCGAIPTGLASSLLFGHKRGAFSGATADAIGRIVAADGGTLFLDEVAELPAEAQVALLRVLEKKEVVPVGATTAKPVDVRIIAATNRDLRERVDRGEFRLDLYARLAEWAIVIPGLRTRRYDIAGLATALLPSGSRTSHLTPSAWEALLIAPWPMNVRELRTVLGRAAANAGGETITLDHLPEEIAEPIRHRKTGQDAPAFVTARPSAEALAEALDRLDGNVSAVAAHFGKDRKQIYRWMQRYGMRSDTE